MISDRGYWVGPEAESQHLYDRSLSGAIVAFLKAEDPSGSVVDLGCGMGNYVKHFREEGLHADGFDGNPHTPTLTTGVCGVRDLSERFTFETPYDWVISLEVGEHLPAKFETTFINNLHANNRKGVILSWARIGQGGHGHVNERNNEYVKGRMAALGYVNDEAAENSLRATASLWWFRNTIMVFRKDSIE
jgi:hypothetical protein